MVKTTIQFAGKLKSTLTHGPSGVQINTAAPIDNNGDGSSFSPTDLMASAALSCVMTIMGIAANKKGIDLQGMSGSVEKHMLSNPRRIGKLVIEITIPLLIENDDKKVIETAGLNCPVFKSIHPDLEKIVTFNYSKN